MSFIDDPTTQAALLGPDRIDRYPVRDHTRNLGAGFFNTLCGLAWEMRERIRTGLLVPAARRVIAGNGLEGGGDLSADRTLTVKPKANGGLTADAGGVAVGAGNGIETTAGGTSVKLAETAPGLTFEGGGLKATGVGGVNGTILGGNWAVGADGLSLSVSPLDVLIGGVLLNTAAATAVDVSGLTAATRYYLYVKNLEGAAAFVVVETPPDASRRWKNDGVTHRYLGSIFTWDDGGTVRVRRGWYSQARRQFRLHAQQSVYATGLNMTGGVWSAAQSLAAYAPPGAGLVWGTLASDTPDTEFRVAADGSSTERGVYQNNVGASLSLPAEFPLDASAQVRFWASRNCKLYATIWGHEE